MQSLSKSPSVCSFQESQSQSTVTLLLCKTGFLSSPGSAIIPLLPLLRPNINSNYRRLLATIKPFGEEAAHVWPFNLSLGMDQQTTTQMDQQQRMIVWFLWIADNESFSICRATRRQSLSEIGFGRIDTYTKLDKLGEVSFLLRASVVVNVKRWCNRIAEISARGQVGGK